MSKIPHLQMLVPGLCGPLPGIQQIVDDQNVKNVFSQLAKAELKALPSHDLHSLLIHLFKLETKNPTTCDSFPAAALSLLGCTEQHNDRQFLSKEEMIDLDVENNYFLHADPVHLRAEMDHAVLVGTGDLNLASAESKELSQKLHQHFKEDDVDVFAVDANHWYVKTKNSQEISTVNLTDAIGRNVNFILPSGHDETYWKQFLNESQMLLHMDENNQQRECHGQLPVNSVWLHGGGALSDLALNEVNNISSVCSDDRVLIGLAKHCDLPKCHSVDSVEKLYLRISEQDKPLLHINSLLPWLNYTDTQMWQQQLEKVYASWLKPLLAMVKQGKLRLTLYPCNNQSYTFNRRYHYKFWRKDRIENYVSTY